MYLKHKIPTKEQIRTFYYRTWHKICKYVDFAEYKHLKKSSKELYGLINFGELRKRLGSQLDDKTGVKLRELVFKGKQKLFAKYSLNFRRVHSKNIRGIIRICNVSTMAQSCYSKIR